MTPEPNPICLDADDSIDLQNLLLTVAESARLLVIGPLLIGALAYGVAHLMPQTYESMAVLKIDTPAASEEVSEGMTPAAMASLINSSLVLNASLKRLGQLEGLNEREAEVRLTKLRRDVNTQVGRNDKLLTVTVAANSPQAAQQTARTILNTAFEESRPRGGEQEKMQVEIVLAKQLLVDLKSSGETLKSVLEQGKANPNVDIGKLAEAISTLAVDRVKLQAGLHQLERRAAGVSEGDLLQPPTLPQRAVSPRKGLVTIFATLVSGMTLLLFVLVRQALRTGACTEQQRERWLALRKQYWLKS